MSRQSFTEATPFGDGGGFLTPSRTVEPAVTAPDRSWKIGAQR